MSNFCNCAVGWNLGIESAGIQIVNERIKILWCDAIAVAVVDLQARGFGACSLAFGSLKCDLAICCGGTHLDTKSTFSMMHEFFSAKECTRHCSANIDKELSDWLKLEHLVEGCGSVHLG